MCMLVCLCVYVCVCVCLCVCIYVYVSVPALVPFLGAVFGPQVRRTLGSWHWSVDDEERQPLQMAKFWKYGSSGVWEGLCPEQLLLLSDLTHKP